MKLTAEDVFDVEHFKDGENEFGQTDVTHRVEMQFFARTKMSKINGPFFSNAKLFSPSSNFETFCHNLG